MFDSPVLILLKMDNYNEHRVHIILNHWFINSGVIFVINDYIIPNPVS